MLTPGTTFPDLTFPLLSGGLWALRKVEREMALISVSRGHFCQYCHDTVRDLERCVDAFAAIGIAVVTTSADTAGAAQTMAEELGLERLRIGYGLLLPDIRKLGLFATERGGEIFAEPSILLVRRGGEVYAVFQHSISCGRLDIDRLLDGLGLLAPAGFPLRGNA